MITNINYNHFYYFWMVSREGSIAKASKSLYLTPQTVSAQISCLEERLGNKLFERQGRQLVLTDFGKITKKYADDIFSLAEEWLETTSGNHGDYAQNVKVGISDALPKSLVSKWLAPVLQSKHKVNITCIDGGQQELLAQLAIHKLDMVFADIPTDTQYHLKVYCHEIEKSEIGFFGKEEWLKRFTQPFPQCVTEEKLLLPGKQSPMNRAIEYWLADKQLQVTIAGHVDDSALMKAFGNRGFGIFPAPLMVKSEVERNYNVKMIGKIENVFQSYYLITPERKIANAAVNELVAHLTSKNKQEDVPT
ncbi:transcriptional activator NhaR [Alteromonas sp. a30]|uniref:transcriptional activator NhaR n=1 Tax=Alteromonas sp. a30 TaxID=2730917 RepID=UPI002281D6BB|nr:transcriptional activator NhaR [Alteromonas sp. a30]MCY7296653.1 transcriptional activator NhaR [Alteromonas sp. a30]